MSTLAHLPCSHTPLVLQDDNFIFTSPTKSLLTKGTFAFLSQPAEYGHHHNSEFQQQIQQLFLNAYQAGIQQPIIVGAIPFDKQQPSALTIPETYQWLDRDSATFPLNPISVTGYVYHYLDKHTFCSMVEKALNAIQTHKIDKVVLSRLMMIESEKPLNALNIWYQLHHQNPLSYNFYLPLDKGALIGASPELLLRKQDNYIQSCPLAGSAKREDTVSLDNLAKEALLHSSKDRYEHDLVTQAIRSRLTPRCQHLTIPPPTLISTPALWHLATKIEGIVVNENENALSLACLLHPTPALCGTPYKRARDLIAQLEPFERHWFGGIVGWSDAQGNGEWVVAIRCGKINPHQIELFAGAGIVPDSQPEKEWQETTNKLSTMLSALNYIK